MKLPHIAQQPVGEFALGNIPQPRYQAQGEAEAKLFSVLATTAVDLLQDADTELSIATAEAAKELSELRAKLQETNTISPDEIPEDIVHEVGFEVLDAKGDRVEVGTPRVFTHKVADEWWSKKSEEIVQHHASKIRNREARAKFVEEMGQRYVAPGSLAIGRASVIKRRAHNQATAENTIRDVLASGGPTVERETQAKEIIARQIILGADPVWAERELSALGPRIDQLDAHNRILAADTADQLDIIEEEMWSGENRMTPEQMRTMSSQMDARRRDFAADRKKRQTENADRMFADYIDPNTPFTEMDVANAVMVDDITNEEGWTFINSLRSGSTTKVSSPFTLSQYRGEIQRLQYTGNRSRVTDKARLLKLMITRGSMGLFPNGMPTNQPATISGEDAFKLNKDIDAAVGAAIENDQYDNALKMVYTWSNVAVNLEGQIVTRLGGNQHQVEAALAFKAGLDSYMDQFGADAKPVEYFKDNKDAFNPNNFANGVNARFFEEISQVSLYMDVDEPNNKYDFNQVQQERFVLWLSGQQLALGEAEFRRISTLFGQFYRGKGIAPEGGALMLEPDDPLYRQFEATLPQVQE